MRRTRNLDNRRTAAQMHALASVHRAIRSHGATGPRKYLREFTQAFRTYDLPLSQAELEARVASADIILVGDYHALPASQQFAASLIERTALSRRVVLGVEAILSRDQALLHQWWRREIREQELRDRLRYDREWGYRWTPFYELLTAARDHGHGIYGLDCLPRHDMRRIRSRDRHAADKISEMRARHPKAALIVLFGESHLAPEHLPRALAQTLPGQQTLTILQNLDAIYWQAMQDNAAAVSLGPDVVCVFNSSPLEKYESYRLCLEKWHGEDTPDFAPAVHNLIFALARTLGFRPDSPHNGTQPKRLADSLPEVMHVTEHDLPTDENDRIALEERGCVYVPHSNTFLVRDFTMASAAAESARFLHHACIGMPQANARKGVERGLAHFGSRLLCPGNPPENLADAAGEALYQDYLNGRITRAEVRRMFLGREETRAKAASES